MPIAFVVGHTGKTGRALCKRFGKDKIFDKVVLVGRKDVDTSEFGDCFECKKVDFDNLDPDTFKGFDQGFCSIGARPSQVTREQFIKYANFIVLFISLILFHLLFRTDRDLVIKVAQLAKEGGCKQYHLVTAQGTDKMSGTFPYCVKAEAEKGVSECNFDSLSIYRPGMILYERSENDMKTQITQNLFKPFEWISPSGITTPIDVMTSAMLYRAKNFEPGKTIISTKEMLQFSKKYDGAK